MKIGAEREGFEPPEGVNPQRFSRPPHSTTLPPLLINILNLGFQDRCISRFAGQTTREFIPLLVEHFLGQLPEIDENEKPGIADEALAMMMDYQWPGNVRELQNAVQFSIVKCRGGVIQPDDLPLELKETILDKPHRGPSRKLDAVTVKAALIKTGGNKAKAAKLLGVGRATLYRFLGSHPQLIK